MNLTFLSQFLILLLVSSSLTGCMESTSTTTRSKSKSSSISENQNTSGNPEPSPATNNPNSPAILRFNAAKAVIESKCLSCHSVFDKSSEAAWTTSGLVVAGNLQESLLYRRLIGNEYSGSASAVNGQIPLANMPTAPFTLTSDERMALRNWIQLMGNEPTPAPTATPTPMPSIAPGTEITTSDSKIRLGDRKYIASTLTSVFGTSNEVQTVINNLILKQAGTFGGPRDLYDTNDIGNFESDSQAAVLPVSTTTREAFRIRTCASLSSKDTAVKNAIAQVKGIASGAAVNTSALQLPTTSDAAIAYSMFYSARPSLPDNVSSSIKSLTDKAGSTDKLEGWRFLFYVLCIAPDWQIP